MNAGLVTPIRPPLHLRWQTPVRAYYRSESSTTEAMLEALDEIEIQAGLRMPPRCSRVLDFSALQADIEAEQKKVD